MKLFKSIKWMLLTVMLCSPAWVSAQLLKGKVVGTNIKNVTIEYSPKGDIMETEYKEVPVKDGAFSFDADLPVETTDVGIIVEGRNDLGAHLTKGKTIEMTITEKDGRLLATYKGEGSDISQVVARMKEAYNIMRYFSLDPSQKKTKEDFLQLLDNEYVAVKPLLKKIKNKQQRNYYSLLNDAECKEIKCRILSNDLYEKKLNPKDDAEYKALLEDVDINDEISRISGLSLTKLLSMMNQSVDFKSDMGPYCTELMQLTDKLVTNPALRRQLVNTVGYNYFTFGDDSGDYHAFYENYKKFAGSENADIPKKYESKITAWDKTHSGVPAPDITLDLADGKQVQLKDVAKGKFTYIDVWATWCGPCKKEIPFMAQMVEKFKDNDKVQFISISIDEDVKAWKTMIENDKPAWPQYNIHKETAKQFMTDWGITGIPRFIMIDKNGNIFAADATRPSEEKTAQTIIEQTK